MKRLLITTAIILLIIAVYLAGYARVTDRLFDWLEEWELSHYEYKLNSLFPREREYIVQVGDTLCQIVQRECDWIEDWRLGVWAIQEKNGITAVIYPGQKIIIPAPIVTYMAEAEG